MSETAYIVVKKSPIIVDGINLDYSTNEAVFDTEDKANDYIKKRKKLKDRDDRGCSFKIEPWHIQ